MLTNKRQYPRIHCSCYLMLWYLDTDTLNETLLANTNDLGLGGVGIRLRHQFTEGKKVDLRFDFAGSKTPFECRGTIVRSVPAGEKFFNTGIRFEPLDESRYTFLNRKMAELGGLGQFKEDTYIISRP